MMRKPVLHSLDVHGQGRAVEVSPTAHLLPGLEGEARSRDLSQFYTPAWLAERVARWANVEDGALVLEPAAGRGALIRALNADEFARKAEKPREGP